MAATIVRRCPLRYHSLTSIRIEHPVAGFVRIRCFDAERQDFWVFRHGECPPSDFVENAIFENVAFSMSSSPIILKLSLCICI